MEEYNPRHMSNGPGISWVAEGTTVITSTRQTHNFKPPDTLARLYSLLNSVEVVMPYKIYRFITTGYLKNIYDEETHQDLFAEISDFYVIGETIDSDDADKQEIRKVRKYLYDQIGVVKKKLDAYRSLCYWTPDKGGRMSNQLKTILHLRHKFWNEVKVDITTTILDNEDFEFDPVAKAMMKVADGKFQVISKVNGLDLSDLAPNEKKKVLALKERLLEDFELWDEKFIATCKPHLEAKIPRSKVRLL